MDWPRLTQLDHSTSSLKATVVEEDMNLFYANLKIEHISVVLKEKAQDSRFVTLAAEPATVLEPSTVGHSTSSERRPTAAPR